MVRPHQILSLIHISLWCYFTTPLFVIQFRFIAHTVRSCLMVAIVFGISVTFYKYNFDRSRFSRFIEEFFKKEEYHVTSTEDFRSCFKELLLITSNLLKLMVTGMHIFYQMSVTKYIALVHRLVESCLTLQLALCLHHVDRQIAQAKQQIQTVLELSLIHI